MKALLARFFGNGYDALASLKPPARNGKRVLINEILSLQLFITAIIGSLAIAGLYWGGQWVLQDNYSRWAMQWTEELNELGAPLYLPNDDEAILRLESFIGKYPEIDRVSYYHDDGSVMFSITNTTEDIAAQVPIADGMLTDLSFLVGAEAPYVVETSFLNARAFEILAPVWTETIASDGLFSFSLDEEPARASAELIGFVGLELDFSLFHNRLLTNIKIAISILLLLLVISGLLGRHYLARALTAISDLQQPIAELAKGYLSVYFKPAEIREIS